MDTEALETFVAVHREQGFSRAARVLNRTQPAISRRISLLEHELGAPLFERVTGGIVLSQAGRVLLPYAERALAAVKDATEVVRGLRADAGGPVSLASVGTLAGTNLTAVLQRFTKSHPRVDLTFRTARSAEVSDLVRRGEVSIGLRYERDRSPDLQCESLGAESLVVVCGPGHRLAGREVAALQALRDERWLAFPDVLGQREIAASHVFGLFLTRGLGEVDWTAVDSLTAQKRLVEAGFGLALMTESSITEELAAGALSTIGVKQLGAGAQVYLVTRKNGFLSQAALRLLELLRTEYAAGWGQQKPRGRRKSVARR